MKFRTQFSPRIETPIVDWPDSIVQAGLCPSISQMVRTRSVGGQVDEYEMDGIESDAPFESEYLDFFDMADAAADLEAEREASKESVQDKDAPPNSADTQKNSQSIESQEDSN